ncbi:sterol carrier family protein [Rhodococcus oxybenzonivorans]|uniref:sterol carrier family protein n=1 Tax=Rhodococcus oxybenzonivorans TaxID=1990687 RepID=UPI0029539A15|nr:sterol carrier family protein [Rhodococcus oxybenzonivorans]MDV7354421.1 sterol carrier family protein [Rhodococcus oxybenzonivorans]
MPRRAVNPAEMRAAVLEIGPWLREDTAEKPSRTVLAAAVRLSARTLEQVAPGSSVEVRVPPFVAVQCIEGPRHTRGTPPNVVETDPRTWLLLVTGLIDFDEATQGGEVTVSGARAGEIAHWLPLLRV